MEDLKKLLDEILNEMNQFKINADALVEKGNKAAGVRARKASLNLSKLFKTFRADSISVK